MLSRRRLPGTRLISATLCLQAALLSVLNGPFVGTSHAATDPTLRGQIERAAKTSYVVLHLRSGQQAVGPFRGFIGAWSDTMATEARYQQWHATHADRAPRFGQPLLAVTFVGDTLRGSFQGLGPAFITLQVPGSPVATPVNFSVIAELLPGGEESLPGWAEVQASFVDAPRLVGVGIWHGGAAGVVVREQIVMAAGDPSKGDDSVALFVVIAILGVIVLGALACTSAMNDAQNNATNSLNLCSGPSMSMNTEARFGGGSMTWGPGPWPRGETRRP